MNRSVYLFLVIFIASLSGAFGAITIDPKLRITDGSNINITEINYQVAIVTPIAAGSTLYGLRCGGALIANDLVVTAAHCLRNSTGTDLLSDVLVLVGSTFMGSLLVYSEPEWLKVHESFNDSTTNPQNDIGLIKLAIPFILTSHIGTIGLSTENLSEGTGCTISGWGTNSSTSNTVIQNLQSGAVSISNTVECDETLSQSIEGFNLHSSFVCAVGSNPTTTNTCMGDGGGPLVCNGVLAGISSYPFCGEAPGIYTDIRQFREWIATNSASHYSVKILFIVILTNFLINFWI